MKYISANKVKGMPFVMMDGEYLQFYSQTGERIESNVFIRLHDEVGSQTFAIAKFAVNIVNSIEEMQAIINAE